MISNNELVCIDNYTVLKRKHLMPSSAFIKETQLDYINCILPIAVIFHSPIN